MKQIKLTRGKFTFLDDQDFVSFNKHKWFASAGGYAVRNSKKSDGTNYKHRKLILLHREILDCPAGLEVDHVDGNRLNNQKNNIRICTTKNNRRNKRTRNLTGYKNVAKIGENRFKSYIYLKGKNKYLGVFKTAKEAAGAYNNEAIEHYKDFACLNKI